MPNVYVNRHPIAKRLGVQRPKGAGLSMVLGCLAKTNTRPTERTVCKVYTFACPTDGQTQIACDYLSFLRLF